MNKGGTVLLVEDNPDDAELAIMAFERAGVDLNLVHASDGVDALAMLGAPGANIPDLILLDLKMPQMSGLEVLRRLRSESHTRRIPVVIMSSSREESDLRSSYDLGANSFVRKPVDFDEFIETARQLERYWLKLNERPPA